MREKRERIYQVSTETQQQETYVHTHARTRRTQRGAKIWGSTCMMPRSKEKAKVNTEKFCRNSIIIETDFNQFFCKLVVMKQQKNNTIKKKLVLILISDSCLFFSNLS